jgi:hypothetical protein
MLPWATIAAERVDDLTYTASFPQPESGWLGFLIEVQFENPSGPDDFYFSTPTSVIPNTLPFADCSGQSCKGTLC